MKIGHNAPPAADAAALARSNAETANAAQRAQSAQTPEASTVTLSPAAASLVNSMSTPEFDTAKVDRIRASIASGTYKINPEAIADKLIANAQELLSSVKR